MIGKLIESVAKVSEKAKEKLTPKFFKDSQPKENLTPIFFRKEVKKENLTPKFFMKEIRKDSMKDIKEKSPFSDYINNFIRNIEELNIYIKANLEVGYINNKECLKRTDIDYNKIVNRKGETNLDLMKRGQAPLDENGRKINLHHIGQKSNAPLAELKENEHGGENDKFLHDKTISTEIDRNEFQKEKREYWKARALETCNSLTK